MPRLAVDSDVPLIERTIQDPATDLNKTDLEWLRDHPGVWAEPDLSIGVVAVRYDGFPAAELVAFAAVRFIQQSNEFQYAALSHFGMIRSLRRSALRQRVNPDKIVPDMLEVLWNHIGIEFPPVMLFIGPEKLTRKPAVFDSLLRHPAYQFYRDPDGRRQIVRRFGDGSTGD